MGGVQLGAFTWKWHEHCTHEPPAAPTACLGSERKRNEIHHVCSGGGGVLAGQAQQESEWEKREGSGV